MNLDDLPRLEFAEPGPVRDLVVAAILAGTKTTTTGLALAYEREGKPYPQAGQRFAVVDSASQPVAVIEMTEVRVVKIGEIDLRHVLDDGDESVAEWRAAHEEYWHSAEMREVLGQPEFTVDEETAVLAQRFPAGGSVKITRIEVFSYRLRYAHGTYVMSHGREATHETGTLVRITTSEGVDGWGEITPLGRTYLPTYVGSIRAALTTLSEALLGLDPTNLGRISRVMDLTLMGHGYAKSALELACWDIFGKAVGRPLVDLIGGRLNDDFPLYEAVPLGSPARMAEFVQARTEAGIARFQLKVGGDPDDDIERIAAARAAAPDSATVVADANGGWQLLQARRAIRGIEGLDVLVEQPCRGTPECALAHRGSTLPMVLDESVVTVADLFAARDAGALAVNLKVSRVGGLARTVQMRDLAQDLGLSVSVEDMWGGDVITAAVSHLAASTSPDHLMNVSFFNDWTDGHVAGHEPRSAGRPGPGALGARAGHRGRCHPAGPAGLRGRRLISGASAGYGGPVDGGGGVAEAGVPAVGSRFAVAADRVFDARAGAWAGGTVVLVEDRLIAGIAASAPDGWPVLEMPGTSLLPGLIDAHTHVLLRSSWNELELARQMVEENPGHRAASAIQAMTIALRNGFTTIRDLGSEGAGYADLGLRDAAREGLVPGPRMLVAGPAIRSIGRYPLPGQQHSMTFPVGIDSCTGADACRETVRTEIAYGIDCLKIYVSEGFDPPSGEDDYPDGPLVWADEEVAALVDEAHRQRIRVAAHSLTLSGARMAVAAGVDSIEHGFAISPDLAAEMAAKGTVLVPTLLVTREHAAHGAHITESLRAAHDRSFVNCLNAGVRIVLGTDVGGFEWTRVPQADEFTLMTRLGMPPADALRAGTLWAAELLGLAGTAGVLEPGAAADIVAVAGDPLQDIECLQQVKLVVQDGRIAWDGHHLGWDGRNPGS